MPGEYLGDLAIVHLAGTRANLYVPCSVVWVPTDLVDLQVLLEQLDGAPGSARSGRSCPHRSTRRCRRASAACRSVARCLSRHCAGTGRRSCGGSAVRSSCSLARVVSVEQSSTQSSSGAIAARVRRRGDPLHLGDHVTLFVVAGKHDGNGGPAIRLAHRGLAKRSQSLSGKCGHGAAHARCVKSSARSGGALHIQILRSSLPML